MKTKIFLPYLLGSFLILFSCKKDRSELTVKDIDGNIYKTIKIGDQIWMAENLKTHKLNDGTPIAYVTADATWADMNNLEPMMCYYDNDVDNHKDKYGALYNWYAVNTGKLAPVGWHVPTDADWQKLQDYLIAQGYNYDSSTVDNKIGKALAATSGWDFDPTSGNIGNDQASNNKSGFTGLPSGLRSFTGDYHFSSGAGSWWSSSKGNNLASCFSLYNNDQMLSADFADAHCGLAVRCVKN